MHRGTATILLTVVLLMMVAGYRFDQYVLAKNYVVSSQAPCDPTQGQCFIEQCPIDEDLCDSEPYVKVEVLANQAPACLEEHSCTAFSCDGMASCAIEYCTPDTLEDGEACTPQL